MNFVRATRVAGLFSALTLLLLVSTSSAQRVAVSGRAWLGGPGSRFGYPLIGRPPVGAFVSYGAPGYSSFAWGAGPIYGGMGFPIWGQPAWCGPAYGYPWVLPPLVIPAETVYGPAAAWRMLDPILSPASTVPVPINVNIVRAPAPAADALPRAPTTKPRSSNDATRDRARRYLDAGDKYFVAQKYRDAYMRYRQSSETAPDLMDGYFRQSQALLAMGRYETAARQLKRGLAVEPNWLKWSATLDSLYGPNRVAKVAHLEALAQTATEHPDDADLLFLVGAQLYFDGQQQRSRKFFSRAEELTLDGDAHLAAFLSRIPAAKTVVARQSDPLAGAEL